LLSNKQLCKGSRVRIKQGKNLFQFIKRPDRLCGPISVLFSIYWSSLLEVKRPQP